MGKKQEIQRIDKIEANDKKAIQISDKEIRELHDKIVSVYTTSLAQYDVKPLWNDEELKGYEDLSDSEFIKHLDGKELQLIFLCKYARKLVHKDAVSAFVRSHIPSAALDQQVRHLGTQLGWNVLNKGAKIPDFDIKVPSGYHYLVSFETPNPARIATALKRAGRLAAKNFDQLKLAYDRKCATCGIEEGKKDARDGTIVSLQQGHMNPRLSLTLENTIPQCAYCNQTYKDYFVFNEYGRVIAVNNPVILLQSPRDIQDEMIQVLLAERKTR